MKDAKNFNLESEVEKIVDPDKSIADEARDLGNTMRRETNLDAPSAAPAPAEPEPPSADDYAMPQPAAASTPAPEPSPAAEPEPAPEPTPVKRRRGGAAPTVDDGAAA